MVSWLFTAKCADEKQDFGVSADETCDGSQEPSQPPHPRDILAVPVDELLEHLNVIAFIGDLMQEVPKHGIKIR